MDYLLYENGKNPKKIEKSKIDELGTYNFLGGIFDSKKFEAILDKENEENYIKIKGIIEKESIRACEKCKKKTVRTTTQQTRSADEPLSTKHTCLSCKHVKIVN